MGKGRLMISPIIGWKWHNTEAMKRYDALVELMQQTEDQFRKTIAPLQEEAVRLSASHTTPMYTVTAPSQDHVSNEGSE